MKKRTRPFFLEHWTRFDGVYRSRGMRWMYCVVDDRERGDYLILEYDAHAALTGKGGEEVSRLGYSDTAFAVICQMAQSLAQERSRDEAAEREMTYGG